MKRMLLLAIGLSACGEMALRDADLTPPADMVRPKPRPGDAAAAPPAGANTVEQFDTTTQEERAAAAAPMPETGAKLGRTVATLGNPADPGFWLETPLVDAVTPGRIVSVASGESVQVELRPIDGPEGAGSRISLPALRLLNVGLAGLHELDVFSR